VIYADKKGMQLHPSAPVFSRTFARAYRAAVETTRQADSGRGLGLVTGDPAYGQALEKWQQAQESLLAALTAISRTVSDSRITRGAIRSKFQLPDGAASGQSLRMPDPA
jgi:hypothetical protein